MSLPDKSDLHDELYASLQKQRGLDPRALKTLEYKEKARKERTRDLEKKKIQKEVNAIRARLTVIEREIERLSVTEHRSQADVVKEEKELQENLRDVTQITKELVEHDEKIKLLRQNVGRENNLVTKFKTLISRLQSNGTGSSLNGLKSELSIVEREIEQLDNKKRRLISDISRSEKESGRHGSSAQNVEKELTEHERKLIQILEEMRQEESIYKRLKTRLVRSEQDAKTAERVLVGAQNRMTGSTKGIPSLQKDKSKLEERLRFLETQVKD